MKNNRDLINNLYLKDIYISKNPSLHEEDSPWKVSKIIPIIDMLLSRFDRKRINLLDVGGGAGIILSLVSDYIKKKHGSKVVKFAVDLSPGMLNIQKKRNPGLRALNEDICKTSFNNKEIDLTLMIDVLEHIPNPEKALKELKRISKYVIFKVPLADNLVSNIENIITGGKKRLASTKNFGHVIFFDSKKLFGEIEKYAGEVLDFRYTNVSDYIFNSEHYKDKIGRLGKLKSLIALNTFRISPKLCSCIFFDFVVILVKCY